MYKKSNQQNRRDDEFRDVAMSSNMRNMAKYRVSTKCTDDLTNADAKIGVRVFKKISLTILLKSRQINRQKPTTGKKQALRFFDGWDNLKSGIKVGKVSNPSIIWA
jgi:hypothetical protein